MVYRMSLYVPNIISFFNGAFMLVRVAAWGEYLTENTYTIFQTACSMYERTYVWYDDMETVSHSIPPSHAYLTQYCL